MNNQTNQVIEWLKPNSSKFIGQIPTNLFQEAASQSGQVSDTAAGSQQYTPIGMWIRDHQLTGANAPSFATPQLLEQVDWNQVGQQTFQLYQQRTPAGQSGGSTGSPR